MQIQQTTFDEGVGVILAVLMLNLALSSPAGVRAWREVGLPYLPYLLLVVFFLLAPVALVAWWLFTL